MRIRVEAGQNTFLVSSVPPPRAPGGHFRSRDRAPVLHAASSAVHVALSGSCTSGPPTSRGNRQLRPDEDAATDARLLELRKKPTPPEDKDDRTTSPGGTGTAMALDEGKMGKKDSDRAEGQYKIQKTRTPTRRWRQSRRSSARATPASSASDGPAGRRVRVVDRHR